MEFIRYFVSLVCIKNALQDGIGKSIDELIEFSWNYYLKLIFSIYKIDCHTVRAIHIRHMSDTSHDPKEESWCFMGLLLDQRLTPICSTNNVDIFLGLLPFIGRI